MEIGHISNRYLVRRLGEGDIPKVLSLCLGNPLYYEHCPPPPTLECVRADMSALRYGARNRLPTLERQFCRLVRAMGDVVESV